MELPDGTPVAGATVSILGRPGFTRTDERGCFTWAPDPPFPFRILVALPGERYAAPVHVAAIPQGEPLRVTVAGAASEEVTVTAEAAPHTEAPPAAGLALLARRDLEERRPQRLSDALENVPGVSRIGHGHDAVPSIRGLARGRTLLLLDGARVTSERRAGASAAFLDPFFLEAIEVSRGFGSVAHGSDAFGGIIHARTRRAAPGDPWSFRFEGNAGEGVPQRSEGVEASRGLEKWSFLLQGRHRSFGDYRSPEGEVPNSGERGEYGFLARLDRAAGAGSLSLAWQSDAARGMERPSTDLDDLRVTQPREDSHRLSLSCRTAPRGDGTLLAFSGFVGESRLVTEQEFPDPNTAAPLTSRSDVGAKDYGLRAQAVRMLAGSRARLEGGVDLNGRFGLEASGSEPAGEFTAIRDAARDDAGVYVTGEATPGDSLSLSAGARLDRVVTRNHGGLLGDASTRDAALSGFAAVTAGPFRGLRLTLQAARGFRDPTLSDRYFAGPTGRGIATGNPGLGPETSRQIDAAIRFTGRRLSWSTYGYHYRIEDLVERFQMGTDPLGRRLFSFRNRGEAALRGVEVEGTLDLEGGLRFELAAQAARGTADDRSDLDDVPGPALTLVIRRSVRQGGFLLARAGLHGEDDRPGPSEMRVPGHGSLDLGGGWRAAAGLEVRLLVRNVLDQPYPASAEETAVLAPGRAAVLTVSGRLGG